MKALFKTRSLIGALAIAGAIAAPSLAHAQPPCTRWVVMQGWYAIQSNGFAVELQLLQRGEAAFGTGTFLSDDGHMFKAKESGSVNGTLRGNELVLEADWGGVYIGTIDDTGRIDGMTYDKRNASSIASWHSDRRMNCAKRADPAMGEQAKLPIPVPNGSATTLKGGGGSAGSSAIRQTAPTGPTGGAMQPMAVPTQVSSMLTSTGGSKAASALPAISRPAPAPAPVVPPASKQGTSCRQGYVRRHASAADKVCVTGASHDRVVAENKSAAKRVQPGGGAYGPNTCRVGYVWREAFVGDLVCVTPAVRVAVRQENQLAAMRVK